MLLKRQEIVVELENEKKEKPGMKEELRCFVPNKTITALHLVMISCFHCCCHFFCFSLLVPTFEMEEIQNHTQPLEDSVAWDGSCTGIWVQWLIGSTESPLQIKFGPCWSETDIGNVWILVKIIQINYKN